MSNTTDHGQGNLTTGEARDLLGLPPNPWRDRIISVVDFNSLVPVAHGMALEKGWWQDGIDARPFDEIIANCHAEVSEAWEEYRAGRMETWYSTSSPGIIKPEGFWVEIADLLIRFADTVGANRLHISQVTNNSRHGVRGLDVPKFIRTLHEQIGNSFSGVGLCEDFARGNKVDLYAIIRLKLAYNVTRPYRHGNKKA